MNYYFCSLTDFCLVVNEIQGGKNMLRHLIRVKKQTR